VVDQSLFTKLQNFGLNQYEAKAYVALLSAGTSNAYNVSKVSGIPRARVYDILESLTKRGVVMLEEDSDGVKKYTALPAKVFLEQAREKWIADYNDVEKELKTIEAQETKQDSYVSTVRGGENILAFCRNLLREAQQKVLISVWDPMYSELLIDLQACLERGISVCGMTFDVKNPLRTLDKHRLQKLHNSLDKKKWFILSVDSKELLYGHSAELNSNAFYTDDPTHIYLLEDYIFHDVLVNRIIEKEDKQQLAPQMIAEILSQMKVTF